MDMCDVRYNINYTSKFSDLDRYLHSVIKVNEQVWIECRKVVETESAQRKLQSMNVICGWVRK